MPQSFTRGEQGVALCPLLAKFDYFGVVMIKS